MLHSKRNLCSEKLELHNKREPLLAATRQSPRKATKIQHSKKTKNNFFLNKNNFFKKEVSSTPFVTTLFSMRYYEALRKNKSSEPVFLPGKYDDASLIPGISRLNILQCWGSVLEDVFEKSLMRDNSFSFSASSHLTVLYLQWSQERNRGS